MNKKMEIVSKAYATEVRISPRKIRLVLGLVRAMPVEVALQQLRFSRKAGAQVVAKLIDSAVANARQDRQVDVENLFVHSLTCDMGRTLKRTMPRARGSAFVIRRKSSNINLILAIPEGLKAPVKKKDNKEKTKVVPAAGAPTDEVASKSAPDKPAKAWRVKTEEEHKTNKVAQKRRLFNRKSGE